MSNRRWVPELARLSMRLTPRTSTTTLSKLYLHDNCWCGGNHMKSRSVGLVVVLLIFILSCGDVWAQATAQISGTAKDQSGAVLPGVEVRVTQTDTGIIRDTITNET